jgi:hypothetical protein
MHSAVRDQNRLLVFILNLSNDIVLYFPGTDVRQAGNGDQPQLAVADLRQYGSQSLDAVEKRQ